MVENIENPIDSRLGNLISIHRISKEFGRDKVRAIKMLSIVLGIIALVLSVLAALGVYDLLTEGRDRRDTVFLLIMLAGGFWFMATTVLIGGLSSRAAGRRSQLKIYQNGFALIQGKRFGGVKTDVCLWSEIQAVSEKLFKLPSSPGLYNRIDTFVGYNITKTDGTDIFISANFEGVEEIGKIINASLDHRSE
ncbi:MAG: DUF6585 family protein [Pyrinomonadaceae bacterium]